MFNGAGTFNQVVGGWDVSKVTNMGGMFYDASLSFNQPIGGWELSSVNRTDYNFLQCHNLLIKRLVTGILPVLVI